MYVHKYSRKRATLRTCPLQYEKMYLARIKYLKVFTNQTKNIEKKKTNFKTPQS